MSPYHLALRYSLFASTLILAIFHAPLPAARCAKAAARESASAPQNGMHVRHDVVKVRNHSGAHR